MGEGTVFGTLGPEGDGAKNSGCKITKEEKAALKGRRKKTNRTLAKGGTGWSSEKPQTRRKTPYGGERKNPRGRGESFRGVRPKKRRKH